MEKEFILCAANYYNDGVKDIHSCKNIGDMLVIHNSFDGSEATDGFNTVVNIFKPKN